MAFAPANALASGCSPLTSHASIKACNVASSTVGLTIPVAASKNRLLILFTSNAIIIPPKLILTI